MTMTDYKWTRIDPSVHTPEWFKGKAATFLTSAGGRFTEYGFAPMDALLDAKYFFLHPPLPDPLEEEIEREAEAYSVSQVARQDWIKGARWVLRRGK